MITENLYFIVNVSEIMHTGNVPSIHKLVASQLKNGTSFSDNVMDSLHEKYPDANVMEIFGDAVYGGDLNYIVFDETDADVDDYETLETCKSGDTSVTVFVIPVTFDDEKFLSEHGYSKIV